MNEPTPELVAALARAGLEHEAAALAPHASFEIALRPAPERPLLGASRLGGTPDFPKGAVAWPTHSWTHDEIRAWPDFAREELVEARDLGTVYDEGDRLMMPIPFLAQIDLADVHALDREGKLPTNGLLLFFAGITTDVPDPLFGKRVASAVVYVDAPELESAEDRPVADPHPQTPLFLRPERRLALDLPWEQLTDLKARFTSDEQRRFIAAACDRGDAMLVGRTLEAAGPMPPLGETALLRVMEHDELEFFVGDSSWVTFTIPDDALLACRFSAARASVFVG